MYINIAVLKETQPHERRIALVPSVAETRNSAALQLRQWR
jgi:alanine dehydrogenase